MELGTPTRCTRTQQIGSSARVCVCVRDRVLESFELFFPICKLSLIVSFVFLSPPLQMACRKTARRVGGTKKRAQRATSNVFAMFDQDQIQEFKEAFNMIDQNRDGFIDHEDLHDMLASLGKDPTEDYLEGMMGEAPGPINFTMFLTMFGERLQVSAVQEK